MADPASPTIGERRLMGGVWKVWNGTAWEYKKENQAGSSVTLATDKPVTPKVQSKGTAGLAETQTKSLSQILADREEKKRKAALIREGESK